MGFCTGMARIGAIITPFIALVVFEHNPYLAICIYGAVALLAALLPILLTETMNQNLEEV